MQIKELYGKERQVVSFEMFPPKKDSDIEAIYSAMEELSTLSPDFISVTYGAGGGGNAGRTGAICSDIQSRHGITAMAHLTCITAERSHIRDTLEELRAAGIENILALRGDRPAGYEGELPDAYTHSEDLIRDIRASGGFCIGAACYPEGHIDCAHLDEDIRHLLGKQEAGADFLVSQLFFDNEQFLRFLDKARTAGVTLPISAGVMPILGRSQIERMIFMCGASLPARIVKLLHRYENSPADLRKAGIEYAAAQLEELMRHGVDGVHIYTMNKPDIARYCMGRLGRI